MGSLVALLFTLVAHAPVPSEPASAPPALSFQATLDSIKINARPGQVVTRQFRLTLDPGQRPTHFKARVEDWWRSAEGRQSFYGPPGTIQRSCAEWVSINPVEAVAQPGATLGIRLTVSVPDEVLSGGYWCALTVDEVPDPNEAADQTVGVRFVASVSTGIFVYLDPVERQAAILGIDLADDVAAIGVRNEGNAPVAIDGRLEFFAPEASQPIATSAVGHATLLTEPSRDAVLHATLPPPEALPSGRYRVRAVLDIGVDYYIGAEREVDLVRPVQASPRVAP